MFTVEELIERLIFASIRLDKYPSLNKSEKDYANREIFRQEWQETVDEATQEFLFMEKRINQLKTMNLYLITQYVVTGWDTYDSVIVCASDETDAKTVFPLEDENSNYGAWVSNPNDLQVKLIGIADSSIERSVLLSSFNAG